MLKYKQRQSQEVLRMTIEELLQSDQAYLTPTDIAPILHCDAQCIRAQAQENSGKLGFRVIVIGKRVRIPRIPFLQYLGFI